MRTYKICCPANDWTCPYFKDGECGIEDPLDECDDFASLWGEDDAFICKDEERTVFED